MDRTLANFIRALRNSEVRISTAETLDAFNAVELCGYEDRDFLKRSLSLVLPKTIDEKDTFDACFDQFFSFKDVAGERGSSSDGSEEGDDASDNEGGDGEGGGAGGDPEARNNPSSGKKKSKSKGSCSDFEKKAGLTIRSEQEYGSKGSSGVLSRTNRSDHHKKSLRASERRL